MRHVGPAPRAHISVTRCYSVSSLRCASGPNGPVGRTGEVLVVIEKSAHQKREPTDATATALFLLSLPPEVSPVRARVKPKATTATATATWAAQAPPPAHLHRLPPSPSLPFPFLFQPPPSPHQSAPPPPPWLVRGEEKVRPDPRKGAATVSLILFGFVCYRVVRSM